MNKIKSHIPTIIAIVMVLLTISIYFFPFLSDTYDNGTAYSFSFFDNLKDCSRYIDTLISDPDLFYSMVSADRVPYLVIMPIAVICIYIFTVLLGIVFAFFVKKKPKLLLYYYIPFILSIICCMHFYFSELASLGRVSEIYPLAIYSLIIIIIYTLFLLSPKYIPKLKITIARFQDKHPRKTTKSERIAELEARVAELEQDIEKDAD